MNRAETAETVATGEDARLESKTGDACLALDNSAVGTRRSNDRSLKTRETRYQSRRASEVVGDQACPRRGREGVAGDRVRARTCFIHVCAPAGTRCVWSNIAAVSAHQSSLLPATTETERDAQRRAHARPPWPTPAPAASRARGPRAAPRNARPTRTRPAACAPSLCRVRLARIRQIYCTVGTRRARTTGFEPDSNNETTLSVKPERALSDETRRLDYFRASTSPGRLCYE